MPVAIGSARSPAVDAFPGSEGFGKAAQGGRGGRIVEVVNLNDRGPGSLRACVTGTGPRNCVFKVSGTILLSQGLLVDGPAAAYLSILGQTAPGEGITLTVSPTTASPLRTPLIIRGTHDVIVRHLRIRSMVPNTVGNVDAVTVEESRQIYVDHVSGSWASDENVSTHGQTSELTIAYSIFAEGLLKHSKCALLGSDPRGPQRISFWRNACISNNDRNPDINHFAASCIEVTDNLLYNGRSEWLEIFSQMPGGTTASIVGNYFKAGPATLGSTYAMTWQTVGSAAVPAVYLSGNAIWSPPGKTIEMVAPGSEHALTATPPCRLEAPTLGDPVETYRDVLGRAGAFPRDAIDRRVLAEVGNLDAPGSGRLRDAPGPLDPAASRTQPPYADDDADGIADAVEHIVGAQAGEADGWGGRDDAGMSSFDRFMEWLSQERINNRYPR